MCNNASAPLNANVRIAYTVPELFPASGTEILFSTWIRTEKIVHTYHSLKMCV